MSVTPEVVRTPFPTAIPSLPTRRINHSFGFYSDHLLSVFTVSPHIHGPEILQFSFAWSLVFGFVVFVVVVEIYINRIIARYFWRSRIFHPRSCL